MDIKLDLTNAHLVSEEEYNTCGLDVKSCIDNCNENGNIPPIFAQTRFTDFDIDYTQIKDFCLEKSKKMFLMMFGAVGTGKSSCLSASMHERSVNGLDGGLYLSMRILKPMIMTSRSFTAKESEMDLYNKFCTAKYLCLDEVGRCSDAALEWEFLSIVLPFRRDNMLKTAFATNMDSRTFGNFIEANGKGADIWDRICADGLPFQLDGESRR